MSDRYVATTTILHGFIDKEGRKRRMRFEPGAVVPKDLVGASFSQLLETGALRLLGAPVEAPQKDDPDEE